MKLQHTSYLDLNTHLDLNTQVINVCTQAICTAVQDYLFLCIQTSPSLATTAWTPVNRVSGPQDKTGQNLRLPVYTLFGPHFTGSLFHDFKTYHGSHYITSKLYSNQGTYHMTYKCNANWIKTKIREEPLLAIWNVQNQNCSFIQHTLSQNFPVIRNVCEENFGREPMATHRGNLSI